jgi:hypothetical protein
MVENKKIFYVAIDGSHKTEQVYRVYACSLWHAIEIVYSQNNHVYPDRSKYYGKSKRIIHEAFRRKPRRV